MDQFCSRDAAQNLSWHEHCGSRIHKIDSHVAKACDRLLITLFEASGAAINDVPSLQELGALKKTLLS